MTASFNLVDRPWLPVVTLDGETVELGIEETLVRAHEVAEIRDASPLMTASLLRLLLAVLHAATGGPKSLEAWKHLWSGGRWREDIVQGYLKRWRGRFDLFDEKYPFHQVSGLSIPGKDPVPASKLFLERASGNNVTLFDHTVEERPAPISAGEATRALVTSQAFALGGGVGATSAPFGKHPNFTHAPMVGGVAVFLEGANLFETLALNLLVVDRHGPIPTEDADRPTWERDAVDGPGPRVPSGYLEYLTWRSRMVRLLPLGEGADARVQSMYYAQGWSLSRETRNPSWAFVKNEKLGFLPVALREGRGLWRDSSALLVAVPTARQAELIRPRVLAQAAQLVEQGVLAPAQSVRCLALGLANDQAKPLFWRREEWPVPAHLIEDPDVAATLVAALTAAEEASKAVFAACSRFCDELKGSFLEVRDRAMASYWASLEPDFRRFLVALGAGEADALKTWLQRVTGAARHAYRKHTDNAQRRSARELEARVSGEAMLEWKLGSVQVDGKEEVADGVP